MFMISQTLVCYDEWNGFDASQMQLHSQNWLQIAKAVKIWDYLMFHFYRCVYEWKLCETQPKIVLL